MLPWLLDQARDPEKAITAFFTVIAAAIAGVVRVTVLIRDLKRKRAMDSIRPTALPKTASDDTPTREIVVRIDHSELDAAEIKRLAWERDDARRLYALAQDDLSRQQRATMLSEARCEVLAQELVDLRRAITGGHTRLPERSANYVQHVDVTEEYDASTAITPPQGMRRPPGV